MSKKGGKRKKHQSSSQRPSSRPSMRSAAPKSARRIATDRPTARSPSSNPPASERGKDSKERIEVEALRFESQLLALPTSERSEASAPPTTDSKGGSGAVLPARPPTDPKGAARQPQPVPSRLPPIHE